MQLNEFLQMTGLTLVVKGENGKYTVDFVENVSVSEFPVGKDNTLVAHSDFKTALSMLASKLSNKTITINDSIKFEVPRIEL